MYIIKSVILSKEIRLIFSNIYLCSHYACSEACQSRDDVKRRWDVLDKEVEHQDNGDTLHHVEEGVLQGIEGREDTGYADHIVQGVADTCSIEEATSTDEI